MDEEQSQDLVAGRKSVPLHMDVAPELFPGDDSSIPLDVREALRQAYIWVDQAESIPQESKDEIKRRLELLAAHRPNDTCALRHTLRVDALVSRYWETTIACFDSLVDKREEVGRVTMLHDLGKSGGQDIDPILAQFFRRMTFFVNGAWGPKYEQMLVIKSIVDLGKVPGVPSVRRVCRYLRQLFPDREPGTVLWSQIRDCHVSLGVEALESLGIDDATVERVGNHHWLDTLLRRPDDLIRKQVYPDDATIVLELFDKLDANLSRRNGNRTMNDACRWFRTERLVPAKGMMQERRKQRLLMLKYMQDRQMIMHTSSADDYEIRRIDFIQNVLDRYEMLLTALERQVKTEQAAAAG
ncbi:MAG TPA: hypothetical protein PKL83_02820 [bacterium]|nr:hypothetical protein [bacterium]